MSTQTIGMAEPYHDRETLAELYVERGLTQGEIAARFGVGQTTISKWLRKTGIVTDDPTPWQDEETLRWMYHDKGLEQSEIADRFGIAPNTVSSWMGRHDITTRPFQDAPWKDADTLRELYTGEGLTLREIGDRFDRSRETIRHWLIEHGIIRRDPNHTQFDMPEAELERLYIDDQLSTREIAERYGCSNVTVANRLRKYDIPVRDSDNALRAWWGEYVPLRPSTNGYYRWHDQISGRSVFVHQLTAIADGADPHDVFSGGFHVHHRNTFRRDNRPSNIELLTEETHMATHQRNEWIDRDGYPELKTVRPKGVA